MRATEFEPSSVNLVCARTTIPTHTNCDRHPNPHYSYNNEVQVLLFTDRDWLTRKPIGRILKLQRSPKSRLKLPIPRNEFEKLKAIGPTLEEEVLDFLSKNRQSAYTSIEIVQRLFPTAVIEPINDPNVERVNVAVENLLTRKAVVAKKRETSTRPEYYFTTP